MRCPCRKKSETTRYDDCCGRYHAGAAAPTAEALMRSRYSAFALGKADYLALTWHHSTSPGDVQVEPAEQWLSLRIEQTTGGTEADTEGTVEFVARSRLGGTTRTLHETSRFVREGGRWLYLADVHQRR